MGQLILSFFLSLKVPQLPQEYDALHYHMGIPRQHLLHQSLSWLNWSSADLWPMPVQFGMAPYWFVTEYPQKVIQWFFAVGVFLVLVQLVRELQKEKRR